MKYIVKFLNWLPLFILFVPLILEGRYLFFKTVLENFYWLLLLALVVLILLNYVFNKEDFFAVFRRPRKRSILVQIVLIPSTLIPAVILFIFAGFSIFGIFCYIDASIYLFEDMYDSSYAKPNGPVHLYTFSKELQGIREFLVHDRNFRNLLIFIYLLSYLIFMKSYTTRLKYKAADTIENQ